MSSASGGGGTLKEVTLAALVDRFVRATRVDGPHRVPTATERAAVVGLAALLADGGAARFAAASALGLATSVVEGRTVLASDPRSERSWLLAVPAPSRPSVLIQVPHPHADLFTERVGVEAVRDLPGATLLVAGAHRRAGAPPEAGSEGCPADVAHRADSVFAVLADTLVAASGCPQVQVHGFADRPGVDVVISPGAARRGPLVVEVAGAIASTGERVALGTDPGCSDLAGVNNVQGRSAARHGTEFVHVELSRSLRRDADRWARVAAALAAAVRAVTRGSERQPPGRQ